MISALADAGAALERPDYTDAAVACAEFVWRDLRDADGRLLRTYNRGQARLGAYLEDHAFLLEAFLTLYETTFDPRWFAAARELADTILARFADATHGGFFATADDHETLIARRKELEDNPIPSGASAAAFGLLRLAALTGEHRYEEARARRAPAPARRRAAASRRVRPPAPGARLPLRRRSRRSRSSARTPRRSSASSAARSARTSSSPAARPTACRCSRAASRSTAAPPRTCASTSPASGPSPSRTSSPRCSESRAGSGSASSRPAGRSGRVIFGTFGARTCHVRTRPIVPGARDAQLHDRAVAQLEAADLLHQRPLARVLLDADRLALELAARCPCTSAGAGRPCATGRDRHRRERPGSRCGYVAVIARIWRFRSGNRASRAVAVLVDLVPGDVACAGPDRGVGVVAVERRRHPVAVRVDRARRRRRPPRNGVRLSRTVTRSVGSWIVETARSGRVSASKSPTATPVAPTSVRTGEPSSGLNRRRRFSSATVTLLEPWLPDARSGRRRS